MQSLLKRPHRPTCKNTQQDDITGKNWLKAHRNPFSFPVGTGTLLFQTPLQLGWEHVTELWMMKCPERMNECPLHYFEVWLLMSLHISCSFSVSQWPGKHRLQIIQRWKHLAILSYPLEENVRSWGQLESDERPSVRVANENKMKVTLETLVTYWDNMSKRLNRRQCLLSTLSPCTLARQGPDQLRTQESTRDLGTASSWGLPKQKAPVVSRTLGQGEGEEKRPGVGKPWVLSQSAQKSVKVSPSIPPIRKSLQRPLG